MHLECWSEWPRSGGNGRAQRLRALALRRGGYCFWHGTAIAGAPASGAAADRTALSLWRYPLLPRSSEKGSKHDRKISRDPECEAAHAKEDACIQERIKNRNNSRRSKGTGVWAAQH